MIFFGQASLQHAVSHFMAHYHTERNHQGLANRLLQPGPITDPSHPVQRRQRLGGMLNYYHRLTTVDPPFWTRARAVETCAAVIHFHPRCLKTRVVVGIVTECVYENVASTN
jgi:hypothetical protein